MKKEKEYLIDNARLMSEWNWEENVNIPVRRSRPSGGG